MNFGLTFAHNFFRGVAAWFVGPGVEDAEAEPLAPAKPPVVIVLSPEAAVVDAIALSTKEADDAYLRQEFAEFCKTKLADALKTVVGSPTHWTMFDCWTPGERWVRSKHLAEVLSRAIRPHGFSVQWSDPDDDMSSRPRIFIHLRTGGQK